MFLILIILTFPPGRATFIRAKKGRRDPTNEDSSISKVQETAAATAALSQKSILKGERKVNEGKAEQLRKGMYTK